MKYTGGAADTSACPVSPHHAGMSAGAPGIERGDLEHLPRLEPGDSIAELEDEVAAAHVAGVPLPVGVDPSRHGVVRS